jgi:hypothetical protein
VLDLVEDFVHENEAALRIAWSVAGPGITLTEHVEGRVNLVSALPGLLKVNVDKLLHFNLPGNRP